MTNRGEESLEELVEDFLNRERPRAMLIREKLELSIPRTEVGGVE